MDSRQRITARLTEHGVRPTAQRVEIGLRVLEKPCHFSAEQLLATLRQAGIRVSKATVYNTLSLFSRHGLLREIVLDPVRLRYDSTTGPHHHFYNEVTGELIDIDPQAIRLGRMPELPPQTEAQCVEVLILVRPKTAN